MDYCDPVVSYSYIMLSIILRSMRENASILVIEAHLWLCGRAFPEPSDPEIIAKFVEISTAMETDEPISWVHWAMWGKAGIQLDSFRIVPKYRRNFGHK